MIHSLSSRLKMAIEQTPKGTRIRFVDQSTLDEVDMSPEQFEKAWKLYKTIPDIEAKVTRGEDWERNLVARRNAPKINNWHDAEALAEENNK